MSSYSDCLVPKVDCRKHKSSMRARGAVRGKKPPPSVSGKPLREITWTGILLETPSGQRAYRTYYEVEGGKAYFVYVKNIAE